MDIPRPLLLQALKQISPGCALSRCRSLSPRVTLLELNSLHQAPQQLILLQHSLQDRQRNPDIARDEFELLQRLWQNGMPVPRPLHVASDLANPFLLTEYVPGETRFAADDLPSFCDTLADALFAIHSFKITRHDLAFLPSQQDLIAERLRETSHDPLAIRAAMLSRIPPLKSKTIVLLHGDFWLGNLLWRGDQLAAIIDWEDAMLGDPLGDVGKCRLETLWALGEEAMELFTKSYFARNAQLSRAALPFWDLWGALRLPHFASWVEDIERIGRMQLQYEAFINSAINALHASQE